MTRALLRCAAASPRVLVVPALGGTAVRLAAEADLAGRGWQAATTPADADVLLVAGHPGPDLAAVIETVWTQMPAPRARAHAVDAGSVPAVLEAAAERLGDAGAQRRGGRSGAPTDRADAETDLPGGSPMADLGEDRDGLTLDRLHVPLGPVLPDWPAALVLRLALQGDVIQEATAELLDGPASTGSFWAEGRNLAAEQLDALGRLLAVAGWAEAAGRARRLRDALLVGSPSADLQRPAAALVRRVRRSRTLRWLVRDIGTGAWSVTDRLARRLAAIEPALAGLDAARPERMVDLHELVAQLVGQELVAARLIVAAADPDTDAVRMGVRGG